MRQLFRTVFATFLLLPLLFSISSCSHEKNGEQGTDMTVLVYMAADNNLSSGNFHQQDIDEMVRAAGDVPSDCRLLVYVDDKNYPRILSIEKHNGKAAALVQHEYDVEHDSGKPETLAEVMRWVTTHSPSERYGLVLWSHGESWVPAKAPAQRVICVDSSTGSWMEIDDLANVLSQFQRLEYILFDACFMQSVEVAYELRYAARYIIASPAEIPNPGAPYDYLVSALFAFPTSPHLIAAEYCLYYEENVVPVNEHYYPGEYYGALLSIVDCNHMDALAAATAQVIEKYVTPSIPCNLKNLLCYYPILKSSRPQYFDMDAYMRRLITDMEDYHQWKQVFNSAVPRRCGTDWWFSNDAGELPVDKSVYGGISCYVPQNTTARSKLNTKFRATEWYAAAGWQAVGW